MLIKSIQVHNIQSIKDGFLDLSESFNCIYGPNGEGKTSILESIWFVLTGKTGFKTELKTNEFITRGAEYGFVNLCFEKDGNDCQVYRLIKKGGGQSGRFIKDGSVLSIDDKITTVDENIQQMIDINVLEKVVLSSDRTNPLIKPDSIDSYNFFRSLCDINHYQLLIDIIKPSINDAMKDINTLESINSSMEGILIERFGTDYNEVRKNNLIQIEDIKERVTTHQIELKDIKNEIEIIIEQQAQNSLKIDRYENYQNNKIRLINKKNDLEKEISSTDTINTDTPYTIEELQQKNKELESGIEAIDKVQRDLTNTYNQYYNEMRNVINKNNERKKNTEDKIGDKERTLVSFNTVDLSNPMCASCELTKDAIQAKSEKEKLTKELSVINYIDVNKMDTLDDLFAFNSVDQLNIFIEKMNSIKDIMLNPLFQSLHDKLQSFLDRWFISRNKLPADMKTAIARNKEEIQSNNQIISTISARNRENKELYEKKARLDQVCEELETLLNNPVEEADAFIKNKLKQLKDTKLETVRELENRLSECDQLINQMTSDIRRIDEDINSINKNKEKIHSISNNIQIDKELLKGYEHISKQIVSNKLEYITQISNEILYPLLGFTLKFETEKIVNKGKKDEKIIDTINPILMHRDGTSASFASMSGAESKIVSEAVGIALTVASGYNLRINDETFDRLDKHNVPRFAEMLPKVVGDTGVQMLSVSHNSTIVEYSPNVFDINTIKSTKRDYPSAFTEGYKPEKKQKAKKEIKEVKEISKQTTVADLF